ncbi:MAG: DUF2145 domain-containing protein [Lysobacteraceae bacterium]
MRGRLRAWALAGALALVAAHAQAGTTCDATTPSPRAIADAAATARTVVAALDAADAPVALVSRVGRDLSKQGLRYSHAGFAVRDHADGRWTVVHLLNDCGSERSALYAQGLVNFFADDLVTQDARITWLRSDVAERLAVTLVALHDDPLFVPRYNLIARPGSDDYENSTAWVLDHLVAATRDDVHDRAQAWRIAQALGYRPGRVHVPYTKRVLGGLFSANLVFTDHPVATRLSGDYPVVTVRSILEWLAEADLVVDEREWRAGRAMARPGPG